MREGAERCAGISTFELWPTRRLSSLLLAAVAVPPSDVSGHSVQKKSMHGWLYRLHSSSWGRKPPTSLQFSWSGKRYIRLSRVSHFPVSAAAGVHAPTA